MAPSHIDQVHARKDSCWNRFRRFDEKGDFSARFDLGETIESCMQTVRPNIHIPALFVDASRVLIDEHAELELLAKRLMARMKVSGEESCRHEELRLRRRLDAYLSRYIREVNQLKDLWERQEKSRSQTASASHAASMVRVFEDLLRPVDLTPNRDAIEQLETLEV